MAGEAAQTLMETRLTMNEAATQAGVHRETIRRWMGAGKLKFTRTQTGRIRIEPDDLKAVLSLNT